MPDEEKREKVRRGLVECVKGNISGCIKCPYYAYQQDHMDCMDWILQDALDLLEPRVLTVDELTLAADESVICYVEFFDKLAVNVTAPHLIGTGKWVNFPYLGTVMSRTSRVDAYNREWRCWNHKPTDEQRKAVAWDD